ADVTGRASFESSAPGIASVSAAGLVRALAAGQAVVTARADGLEAEAPVAVGAPILVDSSPRAGEGGVAVTRETILRFSAPLDAATVLPAAIFARFGGQDLPGRLHISPDRRAVTLFYQSPLPASARVRVTVDGDALRAEGGAAIDADRDGAAGGIARIDFDTLSLTVAPGTKVCGRVFASELAPSGQGSVNVPLEGATITVDGMEDTLRTTTDAMGNFRLEPAPSGRFFVHIDGRTAQNGVPPGTYYPHVGKSWTSLPGREVNVGEVYLPLVPAGTLRPVSETEDTVIPFPDSILAEFPQFAGVEITVPADSLYADDGTRGGVVGISPVPADRIPGRLPDELAFALVFTVQTNGPGNFDVPVAVRFLNLHGLPPGAKTGLWSFNHDTGEWEVVGSMTVSADGRFVETDPGVGILAPGWHGTLPGTQGDGGPIFVCFPLPPVVICIPAPLLPVPDFPQECPSQQCDADCVCKTEGGAGNDVLLHSGEERLDRVDLAILGRGDLHFTLSRRYRSRLTYDGPLGHGWDFDYNETLFP
ncbi:MAG: DUF6531 domain-containing protein, partial [Planctomycetes bacterium]|nr:DUF6531 domain-containing protein [Planctomycetota bacterium]